MNNEQNVNRKFLKLLTIPQIAIISVGILYVSGYYINSIFLLNYGITDSELLRLEYIKIGFVFTIITLGLVFLPLGSFMLTYRVRRESHLPHYHLGATGNALNTTIMLGIPLFLAFFATRYEWFMVLPKPIFGLKTFQKVFVLFLVISIFAVVIVPYLERLLSTNIKGNLRLNLYRLVVEPIRYGSLIISLFLIVSAFRQIPWIGSLFPKGIYFALPAIVFVIGMWAAVLVQRELDKSVSQLRDFSCSRQI